MRHPTKGHTMTLRQQIGAFVAFGLPATLMMGCTLTDQGRSIDRANYADLGSTAVALANGGVEANPLGPVLIPIKMGMGKVMETTTEDCYKRVQWASVTNPLYYGFAANNLAVAAGTAAAPVVGLVGGALYHFTRDAIEPDTFQCVPDHPALRAFAESYATGDVDLLESVFTADAIEGESVGLDQIKASYASLYSRTRDRRLWFRTPEYMSAQIGDLWWHYRYRVAFDGDRISVFSYQEVPTEEVASL